MLFIADLDSAIKEADEVYLPEYQMDLNLVKEILEKYQDIEVNLEAIQLIYKLGFRQGLQAYYNEVIKNAE